MKIKNAESFIVFLSWKWFITWKNVGR